MIWQPDFLPKADVKIKLVVTLPVPLYLLAAASKAEKSTCNPQVIAWKM